MGDVALCLLGRAREKRSPYLPQVVSRENKRDLSLKSVTLTPAVITLRP
jgi:hypothetical protein